jgi:hypothetical protein
MAQNFSFIKRGFLKKQLLKESAMVADDSMMVLGKFETFVENLPFNEPYNGKIIPHGGSTPGD